MITYEFYKITNGSGGKLVNMTFFNDGVPFESLVFGIDKVAFRVTQEMFYLYYPDSSVPSFTKEQVTNLPNTTVTDLAIALQDLLYECCPSGGGGGACASGYTAPINRGIQVTNDPTCQIQMVDGFADQQIWLWHDPGAGGLGWIRVPVPNVVNISVPMTAGTVVAGTGANIEDAANMLGIRVAIPDTLSFMTRIDFQVWAEKSVALDTWDMGMLNIDVNNNAIAPLAPPNDTNVKTGAFGIASALVQKDNLGAQDYQMNQFGGTLYDFAFQRTAGSGNINILAINITLSRNLFIG